MAQSVKIGGMLLGQSMYYCMYYMKADEVSVIFYKVCQHQELFLRGKYFTIMNFFKQFLFPVP